MAYSGSWRRKTLGLAPNPNLGNATDLRHFDPVEPDPAVPGARGPHGLPVVPDILYAADSWMMPVNVQVPDMPPMDGSPEGHDPGDVQDRGCEVYGHTTDDGGPDRAHHSWPAIRREHDASYQTVRVEMAPAVSQSRGQVTQGVDRDGPSPQGTYTMRWIDRKYGRRTITPDSYPLYLYRAAVAKQSPAPAHGGNQYLSPYNKLGSPKKRRIAVPQQRRIPPPYADQQVIDGTTDAESESYWMPGEYG
jgi:hypothetical protein